MSTGAELEETRMGIIVTLHGFPLKTSIIIGVVSPTKLPQIYNVLWQRQLFLMVWSKFHILTVSHSQFCPNKFTSN